MNIHIRVLKGSIFLGWICKGNYVYKIWCRLLSLIDTLNFIDGRVNKFLCCTVRCTWGRWHEKPLVFHQTLYQWPSTITWWHQFSIYIFSVCLSIWWQGRTPHSQICWGLLRCTTRSYTTFVFCPCVPQNLLLWALRKASAGRRYPGVAGNRSHGHTQHQQQQTQPALAQLALSVSVTS